MQHILVTSEFSCIVQDEKTYEQQWGGAVDQDQTVEMQDGQTREDGTQNDQMQSPEVIRAQGQDHITSSSSSSAHTPAGGDIYSIQTLTGISDFAGNENENENESTSPLRAIGWGPAFGGDRSCARNQNSAEMQAAEFMRNEVQARLAERLEKKQKAAKEKESSSSSSAFASASLTSTFGASPAAKKMHVRTGADNDTERRPCLALNSW